MFCDNSLTYFLEPRSFELIRIILDLTYNFIGLSNKIFYFFFRPAIL